MNILILTDYYPPDKIGGVGAIARHLAETYTALGHRVLVITTGSSRSSESGIRVQRGAKRLVPGILINNVHAFRAIRRDDIALVHLHQSSTTLFLLLRPFLRRIPFIVSSLQVSYLREADEIRTTEVAGRRFRPRAGEYLERFVLAPVHVLLDFIGYALSDRVTVVSEDNANDLRRTFGRLVRKRVTIVPNGVPDRVSAQTAANGLQHTRDHELEQRVHGRVVVMYTGVFRTRKRVETLLLALRIVVQNCPEAILVLVGGGRGYDERLRALATELGIEANVIFVGPVPPDRVPYYLSLCDIYCLVSSYEGMPVALLEAMDAGKPPVATSGYGMRDVLQGCDAGVLVPVDDVPAIATALEQLIRNPDQRRAIGGAAATHVRRHFGWTSIARSYLALMAES